MLKRLPFLMLLALSNTSFALSLGLPTLPNFENNTTHCLVSDVVDGQKKILYGVIAKNPKAQFTKYGVADGQGTVKIPYKYDDAQCLGIEEFAVKKGKKWGVVDIHDKLRIPFKYDEINDSGENYIVRLGDKEGVINAKGKVILPIIYSRIGYTMSQDYHYYYVKDPTTGKKGVVDFTGKQILPFAYQGVVDAKKDRFIVYQDDQMQLVDKAGNVKLKNNFKALKFIYKDFVVVTNQQGQYGLYTTEGEKVIEPQYGDIKSVDDNLFAVQKLSLNSNERKLWRLIDIHNTPLTDYVYDNIFLFEKFDTQTGTITLAKVLRDYRIGYIDKQGTERIKPQYGMIMWADEMGIRTELNLSDGACHIKGVDKPVDKPDGENGSETQEELEKGLPCTLLPAK